MTLNCHSHILYEWHFATSTWSTPAPMSNLNTPMNEMYPLFQGDTVLTFSTDGRPGYGNLDIYSYQLANGSVEHMKAPVNGPMDDFCFKYMNADSALFTSNRYTGKGDDDRYEIKFRETVVPAPDSSDYFAFVDKWIDQKIYFDFDKYNLQKDVTIIDELIAFLKKNPSIKIELEAHTDIRGVEVYNVHLSEKRALTVQSELVGLGISADQITILAKGETAPIVVCEKCTEELHAQNRVVIIRLIR